ncbi:hypothetical protein F5Y15DRAFT_390587 [Xylariaceae sp. FL0016]|nr:hypothetical protein F5Y15DRAFT_390587 [Xylariaceae sp. FL0016]
MQALREQLSETQGALTDKQKEYRNLRANLTQANSEWNREKQDLEAKVLRLQAENLRLRGRPASEETLDQAAGGRQAPLTPVNPPVKLPKNHPLSDPASSPNSPNVVPAAREPQQDTITISRARMQEAESQYQRLTTELAEKTKLCASLQDDLQRLADRAIQTAVPEFEPDDVKVAAHWKSLRERIKQLTADRLHQAVQCKLVPDKSRVEFEKLSAHWKTYLTTEQFTSHFFRALVWRYLLRLFQTPCRAWGRSASTGVQQVSALLSPKVTDAEMALWKMHTATLFSKAQPIDPVTVDEVAARIFEAITPFATGSDTAALKSALRDIVDMAANLSATFDRSRYMVLMSNQPGSDLLHGFLYREETMERIGKLGSGSVDLMITPCLLKKGDDYTVVAKAEVIC